MSIHILSIWANVLFIPKFRFRQSVLVDSQQMLIDNRAAKAASQPYASGEADNETTPLGGDFRVVTQAKKINKKTIASDGNQAEELNGSLKLAKLCLKPQAEVKELKSELASNVKAKRAVAKVEQELAAATAEVKAAVARADEATAQVSQLQHEVRVAQATAIASVATSKLERQQTQKTSRSFKKRSASIEVGACFRGSRRSIGQGCFQRYSFVAESSTSKPSSIPRRCIN